MRNLLTNVAIVACALFAITAVPAQSAAPMSMSTIGVGAHGYDFLAGTWTCKNNMPSAMSGPSTVTVAIAKSPGGGLMFHASGANYHAMGYVVYNSKTKMWWNPAAGADGSYGTESSVGTGQKNTWTGPYTSGSGKTVQQRDTYTWSGANSYTDLYQIDMGDGWKTEGNSTCTRM